MTLRRGRSIDEESGHNSAGSLAPGPRVGWTTGLRAGSHPPGDRPRHCAGAVRGAEDEARDRARRLGLQPGLTVQERGFDDDADLDLRAGIEQVVEGELVDEDYDDVVDVVVMWWREDDGDLVDGLVDAIGLLADHGVVWLMTPKPGRPGHIDAEDIADAAPTAGLQQTSTISAGSQWQGTRRAASWRRIGCP